MTNSRTEAHVSSPSGPSREERIAIGSLASLYALRMLGLFMVLPVMAIEGVQYSGATPQLLGLALGIYGLTQALLQIPAGTLSDRIGRKPVIITGLVIFAVGSVIAGISDSIYGVIFGRALQGAGAIASAIMALVTDLTREQHRMKAMASIGASIGLAFSLALVIGPVLSGIGGLSLIFWITAILALMGVIVTLYLVPTPAAVPHRDAVAFWPEVKKQLSNKRLWPINLGIFALHAIMVAIFVAIPQQLITAGLPSEQHSWLYLPVLIVAFILMVPCIIIAEKKRQMKRVVQFGCLLMVIALSAMAITESIWGWAFMIGLYFWGFNLMEASLPSWLSKIAPAAAKGSVMGIFSSLQFLGAFVGGTMSGWLLTDFDSVILFLVMSAIMLSWFGLISRSKAPEYLTSLRLHLESATDHEVLRLMELDGVSEVKVVEREKAIYLKISADEFDQSQALAIINSAGD